MKQIWDLSNEPETIFDIVSSASKFHTDRTVEDGFESLTDEVKELSTEVTIAKLKGAAGADGVFGEAVDVLICALDVIFLSEPDVTWNEIQNYARIKCQKWKDKVMKKELRWVVVVDKSRPFKDIKNDIVTAGYVVDEALDELDIFVIKAIGDVASLTTINGVLDVSPELELEAIAR